MVFRCIFWPAKSEAIANKTIKISSLELPIVISSGLRLGTMNITNHSAREYSSWVQFRSHSRTQSLRFSWSRGRRRRVALGTKMFRSQSPSLSKTTSQQSQRNRYWSTKTKSDKRSGNFSFWWTKTLYQNSFKDITVLLHSQKPKNINSCLKEHQKQFPLGSRESKFQS